MAGSKSVGVIIWCNIPSYRTYIHSSHTYQSFNISVYAYSTRYDSSTYLHLVSPSIGISNLSFWRHLSNDIRTSERYCKPRQLYDGACRPVWQWSGWNMIVNNFVLDHWITIQSSKTAKWLALGLPVNISWQFLFSNRVDLIRSPSEDWIFVVALGINEHSNKSSIDIKWFEVTCDSLWYLPHINQYFVKKLK